MTLKALIFDAEGVIIDTTGIWDVSQEAFLAKRGLPYDRDFVKPMLSGRDMHSSTKILQDLFSLPGEVNDLVIERREGIRSAFRQHVCFIEGAHNFILNHKRSFKIAMATALDPELFDIADKTLGLHALFDGKISTMRDTNGVGKPNPDIFLHAALSVMEEPSRCIVIEDAPLGIQAAHAAGMRCVGITTTYDRTLLVSAEFIVNSFDELNSVIQSVTAV